jgi:hypothetical protein
MSELLSRRDVLKAATLAAMSSHPITRKLTAAFGFTIKSEAQYRSEAQLYSSAVADIGRVATMPIATETDISSIVGLVDRSAINLRYREAAVVIRCRNDLTVVAAIRASYPNESSLIQFANLVASDPHAAERLSGALALRDVIAADRKREREYVTRAAKQLALAAKASAIEATNSAINAERDAAETAYAVAIIGAMFLGAQLSAAGAAALEGTVGQIRQNPVTFTQCTDGSRQRYTQCVAVAQSLSGSARVNATALCQATWLRAVADCYL